MLNKHNLTIASFASKEASRYTLQGILVTPDATVATNGHYLVWVSNSLERKAEDYPQIPGFVGASDTFTPFILGRDAALAIAKVTPYKEKIPVLNHVAVAADSSQIAVTDLERPQVFPVKSVQGQFPRYEMVVPKFEDAVVRVSVNAEYLAQIAKQFAGFVSDDRNKKVTLSFYADKGTSDDQLEGIDRNVGEHSIRFDGTNDGQGMTAVLMPIRTSEDQVGTYGWAEREAKRKAEREAEEEARKAEAVAEQQEDADAKKAEETEANIA